MSSGLLAVSYLSAAVLFIMSLGGLAKQETARRGNTYGIIGICIAIVATVLSIEPAAVPYVLVVVAIGGAIGAVLAARVAMTAMPELVAILHSFVGLAAVLVGLSSHFQGGSIHLDAASKIVHEIEIFVGVFIGGVTFTGSVIAYLKLSGKVSGSPMILPGRHLINLGMMIAVVVLGVWFSTVDPAAGNVPLLVMTAISFVMGVLLVQAIGGADMPVIVSMLNSYSGWAAAATGFLLGNDLLIITGALVGSSGAILSKIMCDAMNRSFWNVVFGGFGATAAPSGAVQEIEGEMKEISSDETAALLKDAKKVMIIPGYGMAVAQAQHPVFEVTTLLRKHGAEVVFGIHPVAGRLPGHMNVLLAEANVPYDIVFEMDEVNDDFPDIDVVLVIGANDIVNPAALEDPGSPIYGMPVLECWKSSDVIVLKRGKGRGYSGIENPLFFKENTRMLYGDAKESVSSVLAKLK